MLSVWDESSRRLTEHELLKLVQVLKNSDVTFEFTRADVGECRPAF